MKKPVSTARSAVKHWFKKSQEVTFEIKNPYCGRFSAKMNSEQFISVVKLVMKTDSFQSA